MQSVLERRQMPLTAYLDLPAYRVPDVLATTAPFDGAWATTPPVLIVEVLSPGTRTEDTVRKSHEYAAAAVGHYWLADREAGTFTALVNNGDGWDVGLELSTEEPAGMVSLDGHGTVVLDLGVLFAP